MSPVRTHPDVCRRQSRSQRAFFAALATGDARSRLLVLPGGVQATVVPVRPWYAIFNSVLYEEPDALLRALPGLGLAFDAAGSRAWTVWVPPGEEALGDRLATEGFVRDSTPMLMAAGIGELDLERRTALTLHGAPTPTLVAGVNDAAHGILAGWSMRAVFADLTDPSVRPYLATVDGRAACALLACETASDCYLWFVATVPEARDRGLASELVRHAIREAAARGCTSATLESTAMAESMYARLGFRSLGRFGAWERRLG